MPPLWIVGALVLSATGFKPVRRPVSFYSKTLSEFLPCVSHFFIKVTAPFIRVHKY